MFSCRSRGLSWHDASTKFFSPLVCRLCQVVCVAQETHAPAMYVIRLPYDSDEGTEH
jgi:hypothetical protein